MSESPYQAAGPFYLDERSAKVERSIEHLRQFDKEIADFLGPDNPPHRVRVDFDAEAGEQREYRVWLEVLRQPPLLRWSLILSDVIQNLRMPLDHIAWMVALRHDSAKALAKPNSVYFPITLSPEDFARHRTRSFVSEDHWARFENFQPYMRSDPPESDPLARLNTIAREDRHRIIHRLRLVFDELILDPSFFQGCELISAEHSPRGTLLDQGTQLGRITVRVSDAGQEVKVQPAFFAFVEFADTPHLPVVQTLSEIGPRVMLAISAFNPEFEELGGIVDILAKPPDHLASPPSPNGN